MPSNLENTAVATGLEKVSFHANPKECSNYHTFALMSHASKAILRILQARLQWYVNHELPDVEAGFRKGRGARDQIANICWVTKKAREFQKSIYLCFVDYAKAMVFPVVMYGCKIWAIKKTEHRSIDAFELWSWRRLLRVPWTARRSNQSILGEISPGCSLEGLMLKVKL